MTLNGNEFGAGFGDGGRQAGLFVAEDERKGFAGGGEVGGSGLGVAAAGGRADDVVAGVGERAEQRGQVGRAPDAHEFHAALGHAVGGVVGQGGVGVRRDDDVGDAEEGGGAHDGAEVVGVADAIEHDQRG